MKDPRSTPLLADAADLLGERLEALLNQFANWLAPQAGPLERRLARRLRARRLDARQTQAILALTPCAAAVMLSAGRSIRDFFEQVEYSGRRLAKMNLAPAGVVAALHEFERLLAASTAPAAARGSRDFQWVLEHLQFCIILALNKAYYQVREEETTVFHEMFRIELEARDWNELLPGLLAVLTRFCRASEARLFFLEENAWRLAAAAGEACQIRAGIDPSLMMRPFCRRLDERGAGLVLDSAWPARFVTAWSVPLRRGRLLRGVLQFAFDKEYFWLPRELAVLVAAAASCLQAAEKARLVRSLEEGQQKLRALAEEMLHVEEAERRRISRELHDQAGQDLLWIRLQLEMLERQAAEAAHPLPDEIPEGLAAVRGMTERTILEIRRLIAALSPAVLEQLGLAAALRQLAARIRQLHGVQVGLDLGRPERLPGRTEAIVYRVVQECLSNAVRHAACSRVNVSLHSADGMLRLCVEDDGVGFDVQKALARPCSFGLAGLRERVHLLGGRTEIETSPRPAAISRRGKTGNPGTIIRVELPLEGSRASAKLRDGQAHSDVLSRKVMGARRR